MFSDDNRTHVERINDWPVGDTMADDDKHNAVMGVLTEIRDALHWLARTVTPAAAPPPAPEPVNAAPASDEPQPVEPPAPAPPDSD